MLPLSLSDNGELRLSPYALFHTIEHKCNVPQYVASSARFHPIFGRHVISQQNPTRAQARLPLDRKSASGMSGIPSGSALLSTEDEVEDGLRVGHIRDLLRSIWTETWHTLSLRTKDSVRGFEAVEGPTHESFRNQERSSQAGLGLYCCAALCCVPALSLALGCARAGAPGCNCRRGNSPPHLPPFCVFDF